MSIDYETYVGPYLRCSVGSIEITKERRACVKPACPNHTRQINEMAYCGICGSPINVVFYKEQADAVDRWDVSDAIHERLTSPGGDGYYLWAREKHVHIYIPNISTPGRDYHLDARAPWSIVEIGPGLVTIETEQFQSQFAADIDVIRSLYGHPAVSIHWGIIQSYS